VDLTKQEPPGLLRAVHRIVKHILIASLFAVAMLGGGEVPILHAPQFADAHALAHAQMDRASTHGHGHGHDVGALSDHDHDHPYDPTGPDRGCTHAHTHCCAAAAILTAAALPPTITVIGVLHRQRNAALPYGQLSNPPLRPPRPLA
jgi:ABC-type Zn2+ transport system substrate-binding protein/surface adhesin